jgi:hypothetical protein
MTNDPNADLKQHIATPEIAALGRRISTSRKIQKRREHFVRMPWAWLERLDGASGQTYRVALCLLYLHWKGGGEPIKLANGMLRIDGVSRRTKWRALNDLERRGLITTERRPRQSPIIRVLT